MPNRSSKNIVYFIIIILMFQPGIKSTDGSIQEIPMQQIGVDNINDGGFGYDIVSAYCSSYNGLLMMLVEYSSVGEWGLFSNITLRNAFGDLFIIQAVPGQFVSIYSATSLEDDAVNSDNPEVNIWYGEDWRAHSNNSEITIFIDWADIGGEGPVDLVFWTGRPIDNPDKLPDSGHLRFDGVNTVDTIGYFIDNPIITSTSNNGNVSDFTTPSPLNEISTTIFATESSYSSSPFNLPSFILFAISILFIAGLIMYKLNSAKSKPMNPSKRKPLINKVRAPTNANLLCNSCGTINPVGSSYCMECGTYIES